MSGKTKDDEDDDQPKPLGQVIDFRALAPKPISPDELAQRYEQDRAMRSVPCFQHGATPGDWCSRGTRAQPEGCPACERRVERYRLTEPERAKARAEADRQREVAGRLAKLERAGIPGRCLDLARSGAWDQRQTMQQAREWYASTSQGLVMFGETGSGKTAAACWCCAKEPGPVAFVSAPRLTLVPLFVPEAGLPVPPGRRYPAQTWDEITSASLVVIDDVGSAIIGQEDTWRARFVELIRQICDDTQQCTVAPTRRWILTSNGSERALYNFINAPQIWDRLRGWGTWKQSGAAEAAKIKAGQTVRQRET